MAGCWQSKGEAQGAEHNIHDVERTCSALPDDLLNLQYDPVTCAIAVGWLGAVLEDMTLRSELLRLERHPEGRLVRVLVDIDAANFRETWLDAIEAVQRQCRNESGEIGLSARMYSGYDAPIVHYAHA